MNAMKKWIATFLVFFFFVTDVLGSAQTSAIPIPLRLLGLAAQNSRVQLPADIGNVVHEITGSEPLISATTITTPKMTNAFHLVFILFLRYYPNLLGCFQFNPVFVPVIPPATLRRL